ncbi:MAG: hypothetical protein ACOY31_05910 [Bacillota bacterium]
MASVRSERKDGSAIETAARFLKAVKEGDSKTFWNIMDSRGQGYFLGLWFYAMETMSIDTIIELTGKQEFLDGVLGPIMSGLRESIGDLLEKPGFEEISYTTPHHARIKITSPDLPDIPDYDGDFIPLVMELDNSETGSGNMNLTCWKIDTLNCFRLNKSAH